MYDVRTYVRYSLNEKTTQKQQQKSRSDIYGRTGEQNFETSHEPEEPKNVPQRAFRSEFGQ